MLLVVGVAGLAVLVGPARPAAAAPDCVALVVDPSPGAARTNCVTWSAGTTGLQVLRAGHTVQFRPSDGLICRIDGVPSTCRADATHYWSYWHRAPGGSGWTYSTEGAGSYHPARNATEGWAYQDGSSRQPANIAFSTICPSPAPAPPPRSSPRRTTSAPPPARTSSRPPGGPTGSTRAGPAGTGSTAASSGGSATARVPGRPASSAAATTTAAPPSGPTGAPTTPSSSVPAPVPVAVNDGTGRGSPLATLAALVLVGVAGIGVWLARSRRAGRE